MGVKEDTSKPTLRSARSSSQAHKLKSRYLLISVMWTSMSSKLRIAHLAGVPRMKRRKMPPGLKQRSICTVLARISKSGNAMEGQRYCTVLYCTVRCVQRPQDLTFFSVYPVTRHSHRRAARSTVPTKGTVPPTQPTRSTPTSLWGDRRSGSWQMRGSHCHRGQALLCK
jgi:hypothetical protein